MKKSLIILMYLCLSQLKAQTILYSFQIDSSKFQIIQYQDSVLFEYSNRKDKLVEKLTASQYEFRVDYQVLTVELMNIRKMKINTTYNFFIKYFLPEPYEFHINPFDPKASYYLFYKISFDTIDFFYRFGDRAILFNENVTFSKKRYTALDEPYYEYGLFENNYVFRINYYTRKVDVIQSKIFLNDVDDFPMVDSRGVLYSIFKKRNKFYVEFIDMERKLKKGKINYKLIKLKL